MTLISSCPLPNYILQLDGHCSYEYWPVCVRFTTKQKLQASTSLYKCLKVSTKFS